jgi:hypothetical protein
VDQRFTVDFPTENEWVITDSQELVHYYVVLSPALLGRAAASQLLIVELGSHSGKYEFIREIYSNIFFSEQPEILVSAVINSFLRCRVLEAPVELVYDYGGTISHEISHFYSNGKAKQ